MRRKTSGEIEKESSSSSPPLLDGDFVVHQVAVGVERLKKLSIDDVLGTVNQVVDDVCIVVVLVAVEDDMADVVVVPADEVISKVVVVVVAFADDAELSSLDTNEEARVLKLLVGCAADGAVAVDDGEFTKTCVVDDELESCTQVPLTRKTTVEFDSLEDELIFCL